MNLISQAEYSRGIGKSKSWINKLVKRGVLKLSDGKIDSTEASAILKAQYDPTKTALHKHNQEQKGKVNKTNIKPGETSDTKYNKVYDSLEDLEPLLSFQEAKTLKENMLAKLREAEYKQVSGEWVSIEEVKEQNIKIATTIRSKLLTLPSRAAPKIYGLNSVLETQIVLEDCVNDILIEFYNLRKQSDSKINHLE